MEEKETEGSGFLTARRLSVHTLSGLRDNFDFLARTLDPVNATSEQATQCALLVEEIGRAARHAREILSDAVLEWFISNEGGVRELIAGPEKFFWPDRSPGPALVKDVSALGVALWSRVASVGVMTAVHGDEEAAETIRQLVREFVECAMSKNAFLAGEARKILGPDEYWNHYDRPSKDKIKTGRVTKLGIGNKRFMEKYRKGT